MSQVDSTEVLIVGGGAAGMSAANAFSRLGTKVIVCEQFDSPNDLNSSGTVGDVRMARCSFEDSKNDSPFADEAAAFDSVPGLNEMCIDSIEITRGLETTNYIRDALSKRYGVEKLFIENGATIMGGEVSSAAHGSSEPLNDIFAAAVRNNIPHEEVSAKDISKHIPAFHVPEEGHEKFRGFLQKKWAGTYMSGATVFAHKLSAETHGADIRTHTKVIEISETGNSKLVTTKCGDTVSQIKADEVVVCAGPWVNDLMPSSYKNMLTLQRQVQVWFGQQNNAALSLNNSTNFVVMRPDGVLFYGFGSSEVSPVKISIEEERGRIFHTVPPSLHHRVAAREMEAVRQAALPYFPEVLANPSEQKASPAWYTKTENSRFIIDKLPNGIWVFSADSGHGFKIQAALTNAFAGFVSRKGKPIDLRIRYGFIRQPVSFGDLRDKALRF